AGHQGGRLGQPGGEPEGADLALGLVARTRAAVETVEGGSLEEEGAKHAGPMRWAAHEIAAELLYTRRTGPGPCMALRARPVNSTVRRRIEIQARDLRTTHDLLPRRWEGRSRFSTYQEICSAGGATVARLPLSFSAASTKPDAFSSSTKASR